MPPCAHHAVVDSLQEEWATPNAVLVHWVHILPKIFRTACLVPKDPLAPLAQCPIFQLVLSSFVKQALHRRLALVTMKNVFPAILVHIPIPLPILFAIIAHPYPFLRATVQPSATFAIMRRVMDLPSASRVCQ